MRIPLGESRLLMRVQLLLPLGILLLAMEPALRMDPACLFLLFAVALLRRVLRVIDPAGLALTLDEQRECWLSGRFVPAPQRCRPLVSRSVASVLWIEGERVGVFNRSRRWLVCHDALQEGQYRQLRRHARLHQFNAAD